MDSVVKPFTFPVFTRNDLPEIPSRDLIRDALENLSLAKGRMEHLKTDPGIRECVLTAYALLLAVERRLQ